MDDLDLTKACAEAIGAQVNVPSVPTQHHHSVMVRFPATINIGQFGPWELYNPLRDDAQALALVKKFRLDILDCQGTWSVRHSKDDDGEDWQMEDHADLNRAVCLCVAALHAWNARVKPVGGGDG